MRTEQSPWVKLYDVGVPATVEPAHPTVLAAFHDNARTRGDHVLVRCGERAFTAREVDRIAGQAAAALAAGGFGRGDRLAIYLQSVPEFVFAVIAAWKLGGVVVTVNPMYRERELAEVLGDSGAQVLVCEANESLAATRAVAAKAGVARVIDCGREGEGGDGWSELLESGEGIQPASPASHPSTADPATFIYTSGTTGPLKAAVSSHGQVAYSAEVYRAWGKVQPSDTIVAIAPLVHVTGMIGYVALALASAATLVLTYRFTPHAFRDAVRSHRGGFTIGPTTAFIALTDAGDVVPGDLRTLDRPFSGGAPIPAAVVERYRHKFGHGILGIYGLTEATGPTHMVPIGRSAPVDSGSGTLSVGLPVPGIECDIVGDDGQPMPPLQPGEIVLRGPQLASGYWKREAETLSTFTSKGLRTGDIGFMDAEGWLYVIDRLKDQINASGFKVWPREVEEVLYEHGAVLECAVVGLHDAYRGETVAAYVALRHGEAATDSELAAFCRERMAAYKVPRVIRFLPELPKTASGKVLRRALRALPA